MGRYGAFGFFAFYAGQIFFYGSSIVVLLGGVLRVVGAAWERPGGPPGSKTFLNLIVF